MLRWSIKQDGTRTLQYSETENIFSEPEVGPYRVILGYKMIWINVPEVTEGNDDEV